MMDAHRMLIVEDHEGTRAALRKIFLHRGYEVATAATVAEGLAMLDPPPGCIVLDLMLPDGEGETILEKVRAGNLPTRVTVCTAMYDPARMAAVKLLMPNALLLKPIDLDDLYRACESPV